MFKFLSAAVCKEEQRYFQFLTLSWLAPTSHPPKDDLSFCPYGSSRTSFAMVVNSGFGFDSDDTDASILPGKVSKIFAIGQWAETRQSSFTIMTSP